MTYYATMTDTEFREALAKCGGGSLYEDLAAELHRRDAISKRIYDASMAIGEADYGTPPKNLLGHVRLTNETLSQACRLVHKAYRQRIQEIIAGADMERPDR